MTITSSKNPTFKHLLDLKLKKGRDQSKQYLVFGSDIIALATQNQEVESTFGVDETSDIILSSDLYFQLDTSHAYTQGAIVRYPQPSPRESDYILYLDRIQDPANVGMLLRSALAFGFKHVIASPDSASFYHEKALLTAKGAHFGLTLSTANGPQVLPDYQIQNYHVVAGSVQPSSVGLPTSSKIVLIVSNEGQGLSPALTPYIDTAYHLPTEGVESLNVGVAGGILMYLLSRHA